VHATSKQIIIESTEASYPCALEIFGISFIVSHAIPVMTTNKWLGPEVIYCYPMESLSSESSEPSQFRAKSILSTRNKE
jgi:hypothetical protein